MSLIKYAAFPTARMSVFYMASDYADLAVIDFSTNGHGLYNYGHLPRLNPSVPYVLGKRIYSVHLTEVDIALGDTSRLFLAVEEAMNAGFRNVLLMPSSIAAVIGFDLDAYADEASRKFGINVFAVHAGLSDDFYIGSERFLQAAAKTFCKSSAKSDKTYNLLGGSPSWQAKASHRALNEALEKRVGLVNLFDNLNSSEIIAWSDAASACLNIVTSESAVPAAEYIKEKFGIPYVLFNVLGKKSEVEFFDGIAKRFGCSYEPNDDSAYDFVTLQMTNILAVNNPKIVCYADIDRLSRLKAFFKELDFEVTCFCSHKTKRFPTIYPDAFIEKYRSDNVTVLSYDSICRHFSHSVEIDQLGIDYRLQTPLYKPDWGINGAYRLCERLSDVVFGQTD